MPSTRRTPEQRLRTSLRHEGWAKGHARPLDLRSGDTVLVIAGRDRGKKGVVERVLITEQRIVVAGVNVLKRHTRAGVRGNAQGGIVDFDAPVHYSNVQLVCSHCDKPTRIAHRTDDETGAMVVVCRRCGKSRERAKV